MDSAQEVYGMIRLVKFQDKFQVQVGGMQDIPQGYTSEQWKELLCLLGNLLYKQAIAYMEGE
jgi:hypothetical protein